MKQTCPALWPEKSDLSVSLMTDFLLPQTVRKKLKKNVSLLIFVLYLDLICILELIEDVSRYLLS